MTAVDERLGDLLAHIPQASVLTNPDMTGNNRRDWADVIEGVEVIATERDILCAVVAHAGDGNTHPLVVHDPSDDDQTRRAYLAFAEIMDLAIRLGGTITGEHGVGRLKKAWLPDQVGDVAQLTRHITYPLDPQNILNPGAVI
jgi:glycolate oxidase